MTTKHQSNTASGVIVNSPTPPFAETILKQSQRIEKWFRQQWKETPAPFYASCDLRNAGYKLAPVDTNLFPAGFNNLADNATQIIQIALENLIERYCPEASGVLIVAENHTRNRRYLASVKCLQNFLVNAGFEARVTNLSPQLTTSQQWQLDDGESLLIEPMQRVDDRLVIGDFVPCVVLLNNDLSDGATAILKNIQQHVLPRTELGWQQRTKSQHFQEYAGVVKEFSQQFGLDDWQLAADFEVVNAVDFSNQESMEQLIGVIDQQMHRTDLEHAQRSIHQQSYVVAKANSGTYGMGVMSITDSDTLRQVNRKIRNKMKVGKGGQKIDELLVQEGVPSFESIESNQAVAEPVVYMIDHYVVGGFYRIHQGRGVNDNLNAPGMYFEPLSFEHCMDCGGHYNVFNQSLFYLYGVVARLALVASAREIAHYQDKQETP